MYIHILQTAIQPEGEKLTLTEMRKKCRHARSAGKKRIWFIQLLTDSISDMTLDALHSALTMAFMGFPNRITRTLRISASTARNAHFTRGSRTAKG